MDVGQTATGKVAFETVPATAVGDNRPAVDIIVLTIGTPEPQLNAGTPHGPTVDARSNNPGEHEARSHPRPHGSIWFVKWIATTPLRQLASCRGRWGRRSLRQNVGQSGTRHDQNSPNEPERQTVANAGAARRPHVGDLPNFAHDRMSMGAGGARGRVLACRLTSFVPMGGPSSLAMWSFSKEMITKSRVGAAGTSVVGAVTLGPVGLMAGALIRGNDVEVPRGVVVTDTIRNGATVRARP